MNYFDCPVCHKTQRSCDCHESAGLSLGELRELEHEIETLKKRITELET